MNKRNIRDYKENNLYCYLTSELWKESVTLYLPRDGIGSHMIPILYFQRLRL